MQGTKEDLADLATTNAAFRKECEAFSFLYTCPACAHVVRSSKMCSLGYPNDFLLKGEECITADGNLVFCKYFELGEAIGWDLEPDADAI